MLYPIIPTTLAEIQQVIDWNQKNDKEMSVDEIILEAVKENAQRIVDEALEGPYWTIQWQEKKLLVLDVLKQPIGHISPYNESFLTDFKTTPIPMWHDLATKLNQIVKNN